MAYTTVNNPELYFQSKIYTGNGSSRSITFDGSENMQPDWSWFKARSEAYNSALFDSVRGTTKLIRSNQNTAEETHSTTLTAFNSNGFSLGGGDAFTNANTVTYASWHWKAGTSFSNDASATGVGSIDSSGSINTTAGFSIITYTGTGSAATFAHGLGAVPKMILFKKTSGSQGWGVYHASIGNTGALALNTSDATDSTSNYFNNTSPTSSVVTVNTNNSVNNSGGTMIAYCFSEVKGYSKMGSYKGNGSSNGPFVYTGFKPSFFLVKGFSGTNAQYTGWTLYDNKRSPFNKTNKILRADTSDVEGTSAAINFLSQGIKMKQGSDAMNDVNITYLYYAVAESPFVNENGVPNNAR